MSLTAANQPDSSELILSIRALIMPAYLYMSTKFGCEMFGARPDRAGAASSQRMA